MSIFVSIASYRDPECPSTIDSLFRSASRPERVFVGLCQQNKGEDTDCVAAADSRWQGHIRIMRLPYHEAKGPTWARYLCSKLWSGEDYFLQIDSHCRFLKNWDQKLIDMIQHLKNYGIEKPILSHYPKTISTHIENANEDQQVPKICKSFFNDRGMISFLGAETIQSEGQMTQSPYIAAGMIFAESKFLTEVPFDPTLEYLFVGEEILLSIRAFTHGYDIFSPMENVVYHEYTRADKPKFWADLRYNDSKAFAKVRRLIGLDGLLADQKYGLGTVRSLQDYYTFAGIDLKKFKVEKNFCHLDYQVDPDTSSIYHPRNTALKKIVLGIFIFVYLILIILFFYLLKLFINY